MWCGIVPDFDRAGELPRRMALPHVFGLLYVPSGFMRDSRRNDELPERPRVHNQCGVHHLRHGHLSGCPAVADVRGLSHLPRCELPDMAGLRYVSGRSVSEPDTGAQHELRGNPNLPGCSVYGDHSRKPDLRWREFVRAEPVVQCIRNVPRICDLRAIWNLWRQHLPELQHLRRIPHLCRHGYLQQRAYVRGQCDMRWRHDMYCWCGNLPGQCDMQHLAFLRAKSNMYEPIVSVTDLSGDIDLSGFGDMRLTSDVLGRGDLYGSPDMRAVLHMWWMADLSGAAVRDSVRH